MNTLRVTMAAAVSIVAIVAAAKTLEAQDAPESLDVAFFANVGHAVPIMIMERGTFEQGIQGVEIQTYIFDSGPQAIESLFAGSIDMAYVGPGPAVNGFLRSDQNKIHILSGAASGGASLVRHPDSDISWPDDIEGRRIAAPQIANTQDVSLRHHIGQLGLAPAERGGSVFVLNVPNPDIYTLFTRGDIDAAWVPEPWATILVMELDGTRLFYEEDLWPEEGFASVLLVARADYIRDNPEIIGSWLEAHNQTVEWIRDNPDDTARLYAEFMNRELGQSFPDRIISQSLSNLEITSDPVRQSIHTFAERADSLGYLGRDGYNLDGIFYEVEDNP